MPDRVVSSLRLKRGQVIAEIGAGTGYFTWRLSRAVGPTGAILAVDLQQAMLDHLGHRVAALGLDNVSLHRSEPIETPLEDSSADVVFLANVAHEYGDLRAGLSECARVTRPSGTMAVVDWDYKETETGPPLDHRVAGHRITRAASSAGWSLFQRHDFLPNHAFLVYRRAN